MRWEGWEDGAARRGRRARLNLKDAELMGQLAARACREEKGHAIGGLPLVPQADGLCERGSDLGTPLPARVLGVVVSRWRGDVLLPGGEEATMQSESWHR